MCDGNGRPIDLARMISGAGEEIPGPKLSLGETGDDEENSTSTSNSDTEMLTTNDEDSDVGPVDTIVKV